MELLAKITAFLVNPDGVWEENVPVVCNDPHALTQIIPQIAGSIVRAGGLLRQISDDEGEFISLLRVRSITIKLSPIVTPGVVDPNGRLSVVPLRPTRN